MKEPEDTGLIVGRRAAAEALSSGRAIDWMAVARGGRDPVIGRLTAMCRTAGIPVKEVEPKRLDLMCGGAAHQGVAVSAAAHEYASLQDILNYAKEKGEPPFVVVCDGLEDPHNLGAVIRTAEAAGAHGVVIPKRRSASLSFAVGKVSAGALEYLRVARTANLVAALKELRKNGCWIYGADMDGTDYKKVDFSGGVVLALGSEGKGLGRIVRENCDFLVSLPMRGRISSLNVSVAAGILMYEIASGR